MTEKRFIGSSGGVYDQYKSNRFTWSEWEEILQIMNNLNEKARERSKALSKLQKENEKLRFKNRGLQSELQIFKEDVKYFNETYFVQEYGLDTETHVQLSSPVPSRKELLKENEQLKQSIWKCRLCGNTGTIEHIAKRNGDVE